jgi:hypothetical protein
MRRPVILAIALLHLIGAFGEPVVAYCCVESGDPGVASYRIWSQRSCCADSCREGDHDEPDAHVRCGIPCCDIDHHVAPAGDRVLLPDRKSGSIETREHASQQLDVFQLSVTVVSAPPSSPSLHPPINTPLRI